MCLQVCGTAFSITRLSSNTRWIRAQRAPDPRTNQGKAVVGCGVWRFSFLFGGLSVEVVGYGDVTARGEIKLLGNQNYPKQLHRIE